MEKVDESKKEFRHGDFGPKYMCRGPKLEWGLLVLKQGQTLGAHGHKQVEETFYFLSGKARMVINGVEHDAFAGTAFRIEPGESHDIIVEGAESIRTVFIKCPYLPDDKYKV